MRKKAKLTQQDLAKELGKTHTVIGSYEKGDSTPTFESLLKLAEVFQIGLDDLVFRNLEKEGGNHSSPFTGRGGERQENQSQVVRLLERRVAELERELKRNNPELAKELGID